MSGQSADWVICQVDQTPIHRSCLLEFGECPTCRVSSTATAGFASHVALPRPRLHITPHSTRSQGESSTSAVPQLPEGIVGSLILMEREYAGFFGSAAGAGLWIALTGVTGLLCSTFSDIGALALGLGSLLLLACVRAYLRRPRPGRWLQAGYGTQLLPFARDLARADRDASSHHANYERAVAELQTLQAQARRIEGGRSDRYRRFLLTGTSIRGAAGISGIGPRTISILQAAGVRDLDSLRHRSLEGLHGIGPQRARLLRNWEARTRDTIERLSLQGGFAGQRIVDEAIDNELAGVGAKEQRARDRAAAASDALRDWRETRERRKRALAVMRRS